MYNHKIKGQAKLIHERIKFHLIFMLEISVAEARWIMESKFASCGGGDWGVKDLRNIYVIMENRNSQGIIVTL